jgi:hypothetical protein
MRAGIAEIRPDLPSPAPASDLAHGEIRGRFKLEELPLTARRREVVEVVAANRVSVSGEKLIQTADA